MTAFEPITRILSFEVIPLSQSTLNNFVLDTASSEKVPINLLYPVVTYKATMLFFGAYWK
jgi:hypothetical protein